MANILCIITVLTLILPGNSKTSSSAQEACHPNDLKGLTGFKTGIRSDTSDRLGMWTGRNCCKWKGVSCDKTTGRVTEINLPGFYTTEDAPVQAYMYGSLSTSITLLTFLEVIDLSELTGLTGTIPSSIGLRLPNLRKLALSGNSFDGPLPESICKLSKLEELSLSDNSFAGSLPDSVGRLGLMKSLDLSCNDMDSELPPLLGNATSLESLSDNFLEGEIPHGKPLINFPRGSYSGNKGLCGVPLQPCTP